MLILISNSFLLLIPFVCTIFFDYRSNERGFMKGQGIKVVDTWSIRRAA